MLHHEVVERRRWIGERRFLHALNFCTLLPGPEAMQLATYLGWLMHGVRGGLAAGLLFVGPGAAVMLGLSIAYATLGQVPWVDAIFFGLKCAVLVLVIQAVLRIGRRALHGRPAWLLAGAAFAALFLFGLPFPALVLGAALIGTIRPDGFVPAIAPDAAAVSPLHGPAVILPLIDLILAVDPGRPARQAAAARRAGMVAVLAWLLPVAALSLVGGVWWDIAWFFSKMAVVTMGGANAVLAYVAQDAVRAYCWLSAPEMLAGLGLAETTPGPLILVLQFVGFLAGFRAQGAGIVAGVLASGLTLWVTFVPCFAFVFLGAPLIERLQDRRTLSAALGAITAAVVGVIANLAAWFALRVLFTRLHPVAIGPFTGEVPDLVSLDPVALVLSLLAGLCLLRLRLGVVPTLAATAGAGILMRLTGAH